MSSPCTVRSCLWSGRVHVQGDGYCVNHAQEPIKRLVEAAKQEYGVILHLYEYDDEQGIIAAIKLPSLSEAQRILKIWQRHLGEGLERYDLDDYRNGRQDKAIRHGKVFKHAVTDHR